MLYLRMNLYTKNLFSVILFTFYHAFQCLANEVDVPLERVRAGYIELV